MLDISLCKLSLPSASPAPFTLLRISRLNPTSTDSATGPFDMSTLRLVNSQPTHVQRPKALWSNSQVPISPATVFRRVKPASPCPVSPVKPRSGPSLRRSQPSHPHRQPVPDHHLQSPSSSAPTQTHRASPKQRMSRVDCVSFVCLWFDQRIILPHAHHTSCVIAPSDAAEACPLARRGSTRCVTDSSRALACMLEPKPTARAEPLAKQPAFPSPSPSQIN
ncbi:uncharacterized protein J3D65DRAFT_1083 [Phyllosticta citribraziliensis]|uniref:Uncharacterized protein n=1 Tax=Phyllosticta citribraziliensis TaxID=989973 RepID=A0ABR1M9P1_9PEZI